jgi:hypothetical protein
LGCATGDFGIDRIAVEDLGGNQLARQGCRVVVTLRLREVAFQDGGGGALAEVSLEHGGKRQASAGSPAADPVSPRRHRPGR